MHEAQLVDIGNDGAEMVHHSAVIPDIGELRLMHPAISASFDWSYPQSANNRTNGESRR